MCLLIEILKIIVQSNCCMHFMPFLPIPITQTNSKTHLSLYWDRGGSASSKAVQQPSLCPLWQRLSLVWAIPLVLFFWNTSLKYYFPNFSRNISFAQPSVTESIFTPCLQIQSKSLPRRTWQDAGQHSLLPSLGLSLLSAWSIAMTVSKYGTAVTKLPPPVPGTFCVVQWHPLQSPHQELQYNPVANLTQAFSWS